MAAIDQFFDRFRPAPQAQEIGIAGFTALVRVRESYELSADVPTTPVEDGSFVNDHIILNPLTLTIEGDVSSAHIRRSPVARQFTRAAAEIGDLSSLFAPSRTQSQLSRIAGIRNEITDAVRKANDVLETGTQAIDYLGNRDTSSKSLQEQFLDAIEALHFGRQVIAIDMPYRRHEGMVITGFRANTNNQSDSITFTINAQKIRVASLQFVETGEPATGVGGQVDGEVSKGAQEGEPVERSLLSSIFGD